MGYGKTTRGILVELEGKGMSESRVSLHGVMFFMVKKGRDKNEKSQMV